jgi:hypothetical protein
MLRVGDRVRCVCPGSWTDGKIGTILDLNVTSSDGVFGHRLQMAEGITVVEMELLELVA